MKLFTSNPRSLRMWLSSLLIAASALACNDAVDDAGSDEVDDAGEVAEADSPIVNGNPGSATELRAVSVVTRRLDGSGGASCTGTAITPWWVLTSRHCLNVGGVQNKDPNSITVTLDAQQRTVSHVTLHPRHLEEVDVMMLRLDQPFTNISISDMLLWPGDTSDLWGDTVSCWGRGGGGLSTGFFTLMPEEPLFPASAANDKFYRLNEPNASGQSHTEGDSGGSCKNASGQITGVHKGSNRQVSVEAWGDWAEARRDCPGFNLNNPSTGFCSAACPCDVGEGDCDSNDQCLPGLYCRQNLANSAFPDSTWDVCDRIEPAIPGGCPAFDKNNPNTNFCTQGGDVDPICPCMWGEGDCDADHDCGGSLVCQTDSGAAVGLPAHYEICVYPARPGCATYRQDLVNWSFCSTACPCDLGQGDCDSDSECLGGLVCRTDMAAQFGKPAGFGVCVQP